MKAFTRLQNKFITWSLTPPALLAPLVCATSVKAASVPAARPANSRLFFEPLPAAEQRPFHFVCRGADYLFGIAPDETQIVLQKRQNGAFEPMESRAEAALHYQVTTRELPCQLCRRESFCQRQRRF